MILIHTCLQERTMFLGPGLCVCVCVCLCVCDSDLKSLEMEIGRPGCETGRGLGVRLGEAWV